MSNPSTYEFINGYITMSTNILIFLKTRFSSLFLVSFFFFPITNQPTPLRTIGFFHLSSPKPGDHLCSPLDVPFGPHKFWLPPNQSLNEQISGIGVSLSSMNRWRITLTLPKVYVLEVIEWTSSVFEFQTQGNTKVWTNKKLL